MYFCIGSLEDFLPNGRILPPRCRGPCSCTTWKPEKASTHRSASWETNQLRQLQEEQDIIIVIANENGHKNVTSGKNAKKNAAKKHRFQ